MAKSTTTQAAKRPEIYYGWYILLVAGLVSISQTSYYGQVISSFMRPITGEFNWTRSQFVGAISAGGSRRLAM